MAEHLMEYVPPILQNYREFKVIMDTETEEILKLRDLVEGIHDEQFVESATEYGVSRWERILEIVPKADETLDDRKFRVLTRLNEQLPFTMSRLHQQLEQLCGKDGYSIGLIQEEYRIIIKIALTAKNNFIDVGHLLERVVPVNMLVELSLKYNQHETLRKFRYSELQGYRHSELRSEVL